MERKIGDTFEFEGKKLQVKESKYSSCDGCFFKGRCSSLRKEVTGYCQFEYRTDNKEVIFVEAQEQPQKTEAVKERKIGEVFEYQGKKLKVVETAKDLCFDCYFFDGVNCQRTEREGGECSDSKRADYKPVIFVEVKDEQPQEQAEQSQKLNLCEILKHCPKGEKFWSPMFGDVMYYGIIKGEVCVTVASGERIIINADGTLTISFVTSLEVMLYPSREQRDWTKVKYEPKKEKFDPKTLKPFDRVITRNEYDEWTCSLFSHIGNKPNTRFIYVTCESVYEYCIPYNDETKHLVGTKDEAPDFYKYWEE